MNIKTNLEFRGGVDPEYEALLAQGMTVVMAQLCPAHTLMYLVLCHPERDAKLPVEARTCILDHLSGMYKKIAIMSLETHILVEASKN